MCNAVRVSSPPCGCPGAYGARSLGSLPLRSPTKRRSTDRAFRRVTGGARRGRRERLRTLGRLDVPHDRAVRSSCCGRPVVRLRTATASAGARSPRGSTTTSCRPCQAAARRSSAASASAVSPASLARLEPGRQHPQHPGLPVGLEVDPRPQRLVVQERQHVVAVHALRRRHVDLDPVVEAEQPRRPRALPDQRVERRQQRARAHPPRARAAPGCR